MSSQTLRNFDDIQSKHMGRTFGRMVRMRPRAVLVLALVATVASLFDPVPWRLIWIGAMVIGACSLAFYEERRFARDAGEPPRSRGGRGRRR